MLLTGHEHFYERFAPQDSRGRFDPVRGVRQLTVGTGGRGPHHGFIRQAPNSEVRDNRTFGVLELTLAENGYDWRLVRTPDGRTVDSGSQACH